MTYNCDNDECKSMNALYEVCKTDLDRVKEKHDQMMESNRTVPVKIRAVRQFIPYIQPTRKALLTWQKNIN
jgi:hypothetical protein